MTNADSLFRWHSLQNSIVPKYSKFYGMFPDSQDPNRQGKMMDGVFADLIGETKTYYWRCIKLVL